MDSFSILLQGAAENIFFYGVMFIFTLAVVVVVHELGHYGAARLCGVYVEKFSFGFGREIFGFSGGKLKTRWSICLFPIGGFVKLFGDVDVDNPIVWDHENNCKRTLTSEELAVSFCTKTVWQRMFIVAAGPAINLLLTFLIFTVSFATYGQRSKPLTINVVALNSAAYEAGIEIGDTFIKRDGKNIRRMEDVYAFTWYENPARPHKYTISRDGKIIDITLMARRIKYIDKKGIEQAHGQTGMVYMKALNFSEMVRVKGLSTKGTPDKAREIILQNMDKIIYVTLNFRDGKGDDFLMYFSSKFNTHLKMPEHKYYDRAFMVDPNYSYFVRLNPIEAAGGSLFFIKKIASDSYKLLRVMYKGKTDEPILGGVSKIAQYTSDAAKAGFYDYFMFLAGFSLMIAFINILPIPALDGGYLMFFVYEIIRGKPMSSRMQEIMMIIGLVFLVGIMIFANVSDLISIFTPIDSG